MRDYHINVFYSEEDKGISRIFPTRGTARLGEILPRKRFMNY